MKKIILTSFLSLLILLPLSSASADIIMPGDEKRLEREIKTPPVQKVDEKSVQKQLIYLAIFSVSAVSSGASLYYIKKEKQKNNKK